MIHVVASLSLSHAGPDPGFSVRLVRDGIPCNLDTPGWLQRWSRNQDKGLFSVVLSCIEFVLNHLFTGYERCYLLALLTYVIHKVYKCCRNKKGSWENVKEIEKESAGFEHVDERNIWGSFFLLNGVFFTYYFFNFNQVVDCIWVMTVVAYLHGPDYFCSLVSCPPDMAHNLDVRPGHRRWGSNPRVAQITELILYHLSNKSIADLFKIDLKCIFLTLFVCW